MRKVRDRSQRKRNLDKWLYFATKTVAFGGNQDEQMVVYTIHNRYKNSQWEIPKYQAKRVYQIVSKKQQKYKDKKNSQAKLNKTTVVTRTIVGGKKRVRTEPHPVIKNPL
jgi:hypothetical protein